MPSISTQFEWAGLTLDIDFEFNQGAPAKLGGPPEDCYPAEGDEITAMDITIHGEDFDPEGILYWQDFTNHIVWNADKKAFVWAHNHDLEAMNQEQYRRVGNRVEKLLYLQEEIDNHCYELAAEYEE